MALMHRAAGRPALAVLALLTFAAGSYYMRQKLENEIQLQIDELSDAGMK